MKLTRMILAGLVMAAPVQARDGGTIDNTFLSSLRAEAARNHPAVQAAALEAGAAARDVAAVRLWDDPMVGLMFMGAPQMMRREEGDVRVMAEQALPQPGLYQAQREKAEAMRLAELEGTRVPRLAAGAVAAKNAVELALVDESIRLQQGQLEWLRQMVRNAAEQAVNPDATSVDALRLESELAREIEILESARRTRESLAKRLNLSLGRPLERAWPELRLPATPVPLPVGAAEVARIPHVNPEVLAMRRRVDAARAETRIADRERQPRFSVGVQGNMYSGGNFNSAEVGVRMTLPWFNEPSYRARVDAARLRANASAADVGTLVRDLSAEVLDRANEAANAAAQARAYGGEILEKSTGAARTVEGAWISRTSSLAELLEANRFLFSIRLEQRRFIAMQLAALEDLHLLVPTQP